MTINATASTLLAMYIVVAEERGIDRKVLSGTVQNDILKEYIARGTYIYPPGPSLALTPRCFVSQQPKCRSGIRFPSRAITSAKPVRRRCRKSHSRSPTRSRTCSRPSTQAFGRRICAAPSFFFAAHSDLFEEVAKFRAARRLWARIMRERFGANDNSCRLRFHTQTGGVTLTAQQPLNNVVRVTVQALAAALGGTQSLHTNGYDEALALPTADAATLALRTQQIVGYESGIAQTVDPLGQLVRGTTHRHGRGARGRVDRKG
jgi:methylmalonyl-CoA mutase N-terminal domain/subunit